MTSPAPDRVEVRDGTADDLPAVATVLDAAMLETDDLGRAVEAGNVLVATEDGRVLGALVLVPPSAAPRWARERTVDAHVDAVAVRRRRRGQGIGSALVEAAAERAGDDGPGRLSAEFDPDVRPFYESLGFEVESVDGRLGGVVPSRA